MIERGLELLAAARVRGGFEIVQDSFTGDFQTRSAGEFVPV
jgi:hypothetical protein